MGVLESNNNKSSTANGIEEVGLESHPYPSSVVTKVLVNIPPHILLSDQFTFLISLFHILSIISFYRLISEYHSFGFPLSLSLMI